MLEVKSWHLSNQNCKKCKSLYISISWCLLPYVTNSVCTVNSKIVLFNVRCDRRRSSIQMESTTPQLQCGVKRWYEDSINSWNGIAYCRKNYPQVLLARPRRFRRLLPVWWLRRVCVRNTILKWHLRLGPHRHWCVLYSVSQFRRGWRMHPIIWATSEWCFLPQAAESDGDILQDALAKSTLHKSRALNNVEFQQLDPNAVGGFPKLEPLVDLIHLNTPKLWRCAQQCDSSDAASACHY